MDSRLMGFSIDSKNVVSHTLEFEFITKHELLDPETIGPINNI